MATILNGRNFRLNNSSLFCTNIAGYPITFQVPETERVKLPRRASQEQERKPWQTRPSSSWGGEWVKRVQSFCSAKTQVVREEARGERL